MINLPISLRVIDRIQDLVYFMELEEKCVGLENLPADSLRVTTSDGIKQQWEDFKNKSPEFYDVVPICYGLGEYNENGELEFWMNVAYYNVNGYEVSRDTYVEAVQRRISNLGNINGT